MHAQKALLCLLSRVVERGNFQHVTVHLWLADRLEINASVGILLPAKSWKLF